MRIQDLVVNPEAVTPYEPPGHTGTVNRRLVPPPGVPMGKMEVVLGVLQAGGHALLHDHKDLDQAIYILEGRCRVVDGKDTAEAGPEQLVYLPAGFPHEITSLGPQALRLLVIYAPPLHR